MIFLKLFLICMFKNPNLAKIWKILREIFFFKINSAEFMEFFFVVSSQQCLVWPWSCWTHQGREERISGGWNRQEEANNTHCDHGPVKDTIKEIVIIHGRWKIQINISDTKHDPCSVKGVMEETEMIPVGWNSHKEAGITQQNRGMLKLCCRRNNSWWMD